MDLIGIGMDRATVKECASRISKLVRYERLRRGVPG